MKLRINKKEYFTKLLVEIRREIYKDSKITESEISKYFNEYNRT